MSEIRMLTKRTFVSLRVVSEIVIPKPHNPTEKTNSSPRLAKTLSTDVGRMTSAIPYKGNTFTIALIEPPKVLPRTTSVLDRGRDLRYFRYPYSLSRKIS